LDYNTIKSTSIDDSIASSGPHLAEDPIDQEEIIECIDSTLNLVGRGVAYAVYLNWSALDRERKVGILGDPRSFRTSIYGLFGEENGRKIETLLTKRLLRNFPSNAVPDSLVLASDPDFVSVVLWLRGRARRSIPAPD
jgi:hypothetical protein